VRRVSAISAVAMYAPLSAAAPAQNAMMSGGSATLEQILANKKGLLVKQTPRGCCQECMGCEAKSEYKISNMDYQYMISGGFLEEGTYGMRDELYALESSSFCMRCCWRDGRAMTVELSQGAEEGGAKLMSYDKPCGCPLNMSIFIPTGDDIAEVSCPCCCFLPELAAVDTAGKEQSRSKYVCDHYCCVSKFDYFEDGNKVYQMRPDTCCCGCCPTCKCGRKVSIPYYFYDARTDERITDGEDDDDRQPHIRKVWAGLRKECCTTADTFAVFFPRDATPKRKAGLLGLTFLLDFTVFERQGQDAA